MTVPRNMLNPTLQPVVFSACRNFMQCFVQCNQASSLPSLVFMVLPREQCFCCLDCGGGRS